MNRITKLIVAIALTTLLTTTIHQIVLALIPPITAYWLLYFILSYTLITTYEDARSKKSKDQQPKATDQRAAIGFAVPAGEPDPGPDKPNS